MTKIEYGFRPSILFKKGNRSKRNSSGSGSVVAIIGAFPCVCSEILHFTDLEEARRALEIEPGVHDEEFEVQADGSLEPNENYYYGAAALKQVFLDKTNEAGASEVIVCNISTYKLQGNNAEHPGEPECKGDEHVFNTSLVHEKSTNGVNYELYKSINFDKLIPAFSKLKKEKFNNLVFAFPIDEIAEDNVSVVGADTENNPNIKDYYRDKDKKLFLTEEDDNYSAFLKRFREWTRETYTVQHPIIGFFGMKTNGTLTLGDTNLGMGSTIDRSVADSVVDSNKSKLIDVDNAIKYLKVFENEKTDAHSLGALFFEGVYDRNSGYILNPVESVALYAGYVAGTPVDESFTQRVIPSVKGIGAILGDTNPSPSTFENVYEELNYDPDENLIADGYKLIRKGATMFECTNRSTQEYSIVSSTLPCGYDIAHLRTSAYIIEQMVLNPFLGKVNRDTTLQAIDSVITSVKNTMVDRFPIVESIAHTVEKVSPTCVKIRVHINFYGIIINEIVYMSMSVENEDRMVRKV